MYYQVDNNTEITKILTQELEIKANENSKIIVVSPTTKLQSKLRKVRFVNI